MNTNRIRDNLYTYLIKCLKNNKRSRHIEVVLNSFKILTRLEESRGLINLSEKQTDVYEKNIEEYLINKIKRAETTLDLNDIEDIYRVINIVSMNKGYTNHDYIGMGVGMDII